MADYPGSGGAHFVQQVLEEGAIVELDDGARFAVYSGFQESCAAWQPRHMVRVKDNPKNPEHPYLLVNIHLNEQAEAQWLGDGS